MQKCQESSGDHNYSGLGGGEVGCSRPVFVLVHQILEIQRMLDCPNNQRGKNHIHRL